MEKFCSWVTANYYLEGNVAVKTNINLSTEIPQELHESLQRYLEEHPSWDQDRVLAAALSLFLLQNSQNKVEKNPQTYRSCAQVYLETLFQ